MKKIGLYITIVLVGLFLFCSTSKAQNPKIKCYFNKPVDTMLTTIQKATYLNGTFPDTVAAYINKAKYTLDVALYNTTSNGTDAILKIITAVNNAYSRGVVVRWVFDSGSTNSGLKYLNNQIPKLGSPTGRSYGLMHNKFVVIDANSTDSNDAWILSGSYNFSVQQTNTDYNNLVAIQNQPLAKAYIREFNQFWGTAALQPDTTKSKFGPFKTTSPLHYFNVNGTLVQLHFSPKDTCGKYVKNAINSANKDLTFGIYTFTDNSIATPMVNRQNAGVVVRGIMDNFSQTYTPYKTLNVPLGNRLVNYASTGIYHNKVIVVDALQGLSDAQVVTGSFNWSTSAQIQNDENLLVIHDSVIANQFYQSLCKNISDNGGQSCFSSLPIAFTEAFLKNTSTQQVQLFWQVSSTKPVTWFYIQTSRNGLDFETIASVHALDFQYKYHYNIPHHQVAKYYRIQAVNQAGEQTYSSIIHAETNLLLPTVQLFPNPAHTKLTISGYTWPNILSVYNSEGKKWIETKLTQPSLTLLVEQWPKGLYWVQVGQQKPIACIKN